MRKIMLLPLLMGVGLSSSVLANQLKTLNVCSDENYWYPFVFVDEETKTAKGWHLDIIREAALRLNYEVKFTPLPWARCLRETEFGGYDAVATASYKNERAEYLFYPATAQDAKSSDRVMQVEYVVVTSALLNYAFDGDVKTLPQPVRTPRGYSIATDLRKEGIDVDDAAGDDEKNLKKLLRDNKGSFVTIPSAFAKLNMENNYSTQIKVHKKPVASKSYFMPFSKKSTISEHEQKALWASIVAVREDADFMEVVASKY